MRKILYRLVNVWFKYKFRGEWVIKDLSLEISEGIWVIAGPNGGGKTTLVKLLLGVLKPTRGSIYLRDKPIKSPKDTWGKSLYLPTNVKAYLIGPRVRDEFDRIVEKEEALELLEGHGIKLDPGKPIYHLSEGQMRILANLTALFSDRDIIFLDEPTIGLDKRYRRALLDAIKSQRDKKNVFVVTNDIRLLTEINDMIYVDGKGGVVIGATKNLAYEITEIKESSPIIQFAVRLGLEDSRFVTREELMNVLRRGDFCRAFS